MKLDFFSSAVSLPCGVHTVMSQYLVHAPLLYSEEVYTMTVLKELTLSLGSIVVYRTVGFFFERIKFRFAILCMCVASFLSLLSQKEAWTKKVSMTDKDPFATLQILKMLILHDLCWSLEEIQLQVKTFHLLNPLDNKCFDENSHIPFTPGFLFCFHISCPVGRIIHPSFKP